MNQSPTVGVPEAAALLHVHPETVKDMIGAGAFPAAKIGRAWVMMTRDVLDYAERLIIDQTAERLVAKNGPDITTKRRRGRSRAG